MIQQYLPKRNIAWDSFWYDGELIASFTRERLEYPLKHISPSGITGTPSVSRIIIDYEVNVNITGTSSSSIPDALRSNIVKTDGIFQTEIRRVVRQFETEFVDSSFKK